MIPVLGHHHPRWENYVMGQGAELVSFWTSRLRESRNILYVLGKGFDPRMCDGVEVVMRSGGGGKRDFIALGFDEGPQSASQAYAAKTSANWEKLSGLANGHGTLTTKDIAIWSEDRRRIGSRSAAYLFDKEADFSGYNDIIVDISALPRGLYFPIIAKILHLVDRMQGAKPDLHVFVAENPGIDSLIRDEGIDEAAEYVHGFGGGLAMEARGPDPKVWIPLLGEAQAAQLERIHELVTPDEICPVMPFPSLNPRRPDDLLLEYRELLFDRLFVEPGNFIYASERNPFDVYRQVRRAIFQYRSALAPLGKCKAVISAQSTKLLSVGALLVAYELKQLKMDVAIANIESQGYAMGAVEKCPGSEVFGLWLTEAPNGADGQA